MFLWLNDNLLPCAYKTIFGIDCPLCGSQRSAMQLLNGNFAESFSIYPPLIPVLSLIVIASLKLFTRELIGTRFLKTYSLVVLLIVLVNYVLKMIE